MSQEVEVGGRKYKVELSTVPAPGEPAVHGEVCSLLTVLSFSWRPSLSAVLHPLQDRVSLVERPSGGRGFCCPHCLPFGAGSPVWQLLLSLPSTHPPG